MALKMFFKEFRIFWNFDIFWAASKLNSNSALRFHFHGLISPINLLNKSYHVILVIFELAR